VELVTVMLSKEQLLGQIPEISAIFMSLGVDMLFVEYGWGADLPQDELWKEISVPTDQLGIFVESSIAKRFFTPGVADLHISDENKIVQFKLCHEADIHLTTQDQTVLNRVAHEWTKEGIQGYKSEGTAQWSSMKI
jgi:hypothetical protein